MTYRTVVVGTDGSETAVRAVKQAIDLAAADGARLVVVTAYEEDPHPRSDDRAPDDLRWMLTDRNEAERHARHGRELAAERGLSGVVVQALAGDPGAMLLETATDFDADLIVVGSVGLTGSSRFILGSVASTVLHHAPCDVLVVHTH